MSPSLTFFREDCSVVILPSSDAPRLLLNAAHAWRASRLYPAQRLAARTVRLLLRLSVLLRRGRPRGDLAPGGVPAWVEELAPLRPSAVLIGTPGPAQKLVVQFVDGDGSVALYAKLAAKPAARHRLRNESAMLECLPAGLAPRRVAFLPQEDHDVLLLEPVAGRPARATAGDARLAHAYLDRLWRATERPASGDHPWLVRMWRREPGLRPWVEALAAAGLPRVAGHGDFAPWNLLRGGGTTVAIDWEYGCPDALCGADLAYWWLQTDALLRRLSPRDARDRASREVANALGLGGRVAQALVRLTAAAGHNEAVRDGHGAGEPLMRWRREVAFA